MATTEFHAHCPHCGRRHDLHSGTGDARPSDGDFSICWGCKLPAVYVQIGEALSLRALTQDEQAQYGSQIMAQIAAVARYQDPVMAARNLNDGLSARDSAG